MKLNPKVTGFLARTGAKMKTNSPTILLVGGIVCGIGAVVTAVHATTKASRVKDILDQELDLIEETYENVKTLNEAGSKAVVHYDEKTKQTDTRIAYAHAIWGYTKLYAPTVILEATSLSMILFSHGIMKKRISALTAACATVTDMFNRYRQNVREEFGEEVDKRMRYGLTAEKVKTQVTDPETGKTKTVTKEVLKKKDSLPWRSDYAKIYDESCRGWVKDANQNYLTLRAQEAYCTQKLHTNGFLFLNEVYELLGMDMTEAGSEVGWIYEKDNPEGDNYVDFHLGDHPDFVSGLERNVWLDFNVDGPIRHRIKWAKY